MSIFSYLPICSLLVVRAGLHMETEVQRTCTQLIPARTRWFAILALQGSVMSC
jgi:hypothetical protein